MVGRGPLGELMDLCLEPNSATYWRRKWQATPVSLPGEPLKNALKVFLDFTMKIPLDRNLRISLILSCI